MASALPMPTSRLPRTAPPAARNTNLAPRANPAGVDQARPSSHTSLVIAGIGIAPRMEVHHSPIALESSGSTSMARPILPPGSSG